MLYSPLYGCSRAMIWAGGSVTISRIFSPCFLAVDITYLMSVTPAKIIVAEQSAKGSTSRRCASRTPLPAID